MSNNGLPKLTNSMYTRAQPDLCGVCKNYRARAGINFHLGWDVCVAKAKYISNAHTLKGKCSEFEQASEQIATNETIAAWKEDAADHQEWLKNRKRGYR